jgi:hypothetical protein
MTTYTDIVSAYETAQANLALAWQRYHTAEAAMGRDEEMAAVDAAIEAADAATDALDNAHDCRFCDNLVDEDEGICASCDAKDGL